MSDKQKYPAQKVNLYLLLKNRNRSRQQQNRQRGSAMAIASVSIVALVALFKLAERRWLAHLRAQRVESTAT